MRMSGMALGEDWTRPRFALGAVAAFVVGTLLLAGAVHISAILMVPVLAKSDGWSRLVPYAGDNRFAEIPLADTARSKGVAGLDPMFLNGACRIDLADAPAGIRVDANDRFWSLALYDPKGVIVFSLNDRTAVDGSLDMIVANAAQNAELQKSPTFEIEMTIVTESPSDDLIALLRLYAPTDAARKDARAILAKTECLPAPSVLPSASDSGG
jgi:uncharacterized membrane protein